MGLSETPFRQKVSKVWNIRHDRKSCGEDSETGHIIGQIAEELHLHPLTAALLYSRGLRDVGAASRFISKESVILHDPFLLTDMDKAVKRICRAIDSGEKIVIYGDYDVDGVTSVSTLYLYLKSKGADTGYYIPNRSGEGYGVNNGAIDRLATEGARLIVTVDTGITAHEEVQYAAALGVDMIVTDHHECRETLPEAVAVVNARRPDCPYPFKELAGVGVVFKLICALEQTLGAGEGYDGLRAVCMEYADLVAIGTVADVMPLVDENRLIVSMGLKIIEHTKRMGLYALLELSGALSETKSGKTAKKRKITSSLIGYVVAPRINAAGRISTASRAVELFLTESVTEAYAIAGELCETNRKRQAEENTIIEQACRKIESEHDFAHDPVIVLAEDGWHHGVIGIVASRITEHYNLPSILISFEDDVGKGSGRSVKGLNLVEALTACGDCLIKFGGHELAAGLSIERGRLGEFKRAVNEYARSALCDVGLVTTIEIDMELEAREINLSAANELYCLEPYGIANPTPVFILRDAQVLDVIPIGSNRHTKMLLAKDGVSFAAVYFGAAASTLDIYAGDEIDVVFNLDINDFQNVQTVQLIVRDLDFSEHYRRALEERLEWYQEVREGRKIRRDEPIVPTHDDFARVFLYIKNETRRGNEIISLHAINRHLRGGAAEFVKIKFIIDIFHEMNILKIEPVESGSCNERYHFGLNHTVGKVNLEKSSIYKKLKSRQEKI